MSEWSNAYVYVVPSTYVNTLLSLCASTYESLAVCAGSIKVCNAFHTPWCLASFMVLSKESKEGVI